MSRPELHQALAALIEALDGPAIDGSLQISEAEMTVPFEVIVTAGPDGLKAFGAPPESRFESGMMQPVHRVSLRARREGSRGRE